MNRGWRTAGLAEIDQVAIAAQNRKALGPGGSADRVKHGVYAQAIRSVMNEARQGGATPGQVSNLSTLRTVTLPVIKS